MPRLEGRRNHSAVWLLLLLVLAIVVILVLNSYGMVHLFPGYGVY